MDILQKKDIIARNLEGVRLRINEASQRSGRNPADVCLVAVTKTVGIEEIGILRDLGVSDFGENRIPIAASKITALSGKLRWHMIGHMQRKKVKKALELFDVYHSLDTLRLAEEFSVRAQSNSQELTLLIEVNTGGEAAKHGVEPKQARALAMGASRLPGLRIAGLMTMAPFVDDMEICRQCFRQLRETADSIRADESETLRMEHLSMGMSQDFEVAVEEGATMVRVGSALFRGLAVE